MGWSILPNIDSDTNGTFFMLKSSLLALAVCGLVAAGPCMAHAKLAVLKLVQDGKEIPVPLDKGAKPGQTFTLTLPALSPGNYTVQWTAVAADDGHVTKGSFVFSIAA
jgi:CopC domain